jgi:EAL and modified HD-GYP domain-containing signal transduction protein
LATQFKRDDKILLAEKVETLEQFELCLMLGFDYFQGYYFARPSVMTGKILAPAQAAILQIMQLIESDAENIDIERQLKQDATLGLNLLRLVSTPGLGITRSIDSLSQALLILGRYQLQRWLQILLYAEHGKGDGSHAAAALLTLATTRGKQLELLAQKLRPGNRTCADMAYTVGIMSLVDTLLGVSMEQILTQLAVSEDVSAALLFRQGFLGELLRVAEYTEQLDEAGDKLRTLLVELGLSSDDLCGLQLQAYEWSFNISKQFH